MLQVTCVCGHSMAVEPDGKHKRCICGRMVYAKVGDLEEDMVTPWVTEFDWHLAQPESRKHPAPIAGKWFGRK